MLQASDFGRFDNRGESVAKSMASQLARIRLSFVTGQRRLSVEETSFVTWPRSIRRRATISAVYPRKEDRRRWITMLDMLVRAVRLEEVWLVSFCCSAHSLAGRRKPRQAVRAFLNESATACDEKSGGGSEAAEESAADDDDDPMLIGMKQRKARGPRSYFISVDSFPSGKGKKVFNSTSKRGQAVSPSSPLFLAESLG